MAEIQIPNLSEFANLTPSEVTAFSDSTRLVVWTNNCAKVISLANPNTCKVLNFSQIVFCTISAGIVYVISEHNQKQTITQVRKLRDFDFTLNKGEQCKYIETMEDGFMAGTTTGEIITIQGQVENRTKICQEPITVIKVNYNDKKITIGTESGALYIVNFDFTNFDHAPSISMIPLVQSTVMGIEYLNDLILVTRSAPCSLISYRIEGESIVEADHNYTFQENQRYISVYNSGDCLFLNIVRTQIENVHELQVFIFDGSDLNLFTTDQLEGNEVDFRIRESYKTYSEQWVDMLILRDGGSKLQLKRLSNSETLMGITIQKFLEHPDMGRNQIILQNLVDQGKNKGLIDERDSTNYGLLNYIFSQNQGTLIANLGLPETAEWLQGKFDELKGKVDEVMRRFRMPNLNETTNYVVREIAEIECQLYVCREVDVRGEVLYGQCDHILHILSVAKWFFQYEVGQYFNQQALDAMQWGLRREQRAESIRRIEAQLLECSVKYTGTGLFIDSLSPGLTPPSLNILKELLDTLDSQTFHRVMLYVFQDLIRQNYAISQLKESYSQYFLIPEAEDALVAGMYKLDSLFDDTMDKSSETSSALFLLSAAGAIVDKQQVFCALVEAGCYAAAVSWGKSLSWASSTFIEIWAWVIVKTGNWYLYCGEVPKETIIKFMAHFKQFKELIQIPESENFLSGQLLEMAKTLYLTS